MSDTVSRLKLLKGLPRTFPIPPANDDIMLLIGVADFSQAISLNYKKSPEEYNSSSTGEKISQTL